MVNAHVPDETKQYAMNHRALEEAIAKREAILGSDGRILVRPSGTEPLIRVMIEGVDQTQIDGLVHELREVIECICSEIGES